MPVKDSNLPRRRFLQNVSKAGLLAAFGMPEASTAATSSKEPVGDDALSVMLTQPYLQAPSADGITIMWLTSKPCYSYVEYGEGGAMDKKAHSVADGLVSANNTLNKIRLTGLKPATQYSYRVVSKEIASFEPYDLKYGATTASQTFTFKTIDPAASRLDWLIINDIHDRPESIPHLMKLNGSDPYDFVFFNGDVFDYQTDEQQIINHMLKPSTDLFASTTPFLFVRGNHETRGKYARQLPDYFDSISKNFYFSFKRGPVYAIVLDTGEDKEDTHPVYGGIVDFDAYRQQQAVWLEKELQSKAFRKAKYRVIMMHIPHQYSGDAHGPMHCRQLFGPLFDKYKIDIFIAGHTHKYGVYAPVEGKHGYPIIIGGGPKDGKRTLIKIKADADSLQLKMLRDDGEEVGSYTVKSKR